MQELKSLSNFDKKTFKKVFNEYYQPLCHLSRHYLDNEEEAKDIVGDAFIKLWEIKHELNPNSNLQNFLFTIVKNNSLNALKSRQIRLDHHEIIRATEIRYQSESLNLLTENYLELNELNSKIDAAIQKLPERCRVVFRMSRFEKKKNREIAAELGITVKAVEARMTKALKILRNELKDYLPLIFIVSKLLN